MIPRPCATCGTIFDAKNNSPSRKFCSRTCYSEAQKVRVPRTCVGCDSVFIAKLSEVKRRGGKYCSRACFFAHPPPSPALRRDVADKISAAKTTTGKKAGLRQRQAEHAGMTLAGKGETACRNCGATGHLNLHHAIPRSMWKAGILQPLNGIPLCVACHTGWHLRHVTIRRTVFTPAEWACLLGACLVGQNIVAWLDDRYPA